MRALAGLLVSLAAACTIPPAAAEPSDRSSWSEERDGVAIRMFRGDDRAIVCISSRPPLQLSGEYGVHASWGAKPASPDSIAVYPAQEYFTGPLKLELALPRGNRTLNLDVGVCLPGETCNSAEFAYNLQKLSRSAAADCKP